MLISCSCYICGTPLVRQRRQSGRYRCVSGPCVSTVNSTSRTSDRPTKEWLIEEYINKHRPCPDISREIGVDPSTIRLWLVAHGIKTRKRGSATPQNWFKKGRPSLFSGHRHTDATKDRIRQDRLRDGRIPALVNGVHWMRYYGRKPGSWKGGITPERQAFYSTKEWRRAVAIVWRRDNATCQWCGLDFRKVRERQVRRISFHIHHIDSFSVVDRRAEPENLILLCEICHRWVHGSNNPLRILLGRGH